MWTGKGDAPGQDAGVGVGSAVRVLFDKLLYPGTIRAWHASGLCTVEFDDGEVHHDVASSELKPIRQVASRGGRIEEPATAIQPSDEQLTDAKAKLEKTWDFNLPPASISPSRCLGGKHHCGGDLCFPNLTLLHEKCGHRMPLFPMVAGAAVAFDAATLCHGTTEHEDPAMRAEGCGAHVSFACQVPAAVLGVSTSAGTWQKVHQSVLDLARMDERSHWSGSDVVRLPVLNFANVPSPTGRLEVDLKHMCPLAWRRVVSSKSHLAAPIKDNFVPTNCRHHHSHDKHHVLCCIAT